MSCVSCAHHIEKSISKMDGVISSEVNFATETIKVNFDENRVNFDQMNQLVQPLGYSLLDNKQKESDKIKVPYSEYTGINQSKEEKIIEVAKMKENVFITIPFIVFSFIFMIWDMGSH